MFVLRRSRALFVLLLGALWVGVTGCSDRSREWDRLSDRHTRLYPLLWGQQIEPSELENSRRRFDCIWDGLTRAGREPGEDVDCWIRQLDVAIACSPGEPRYEVCQERASRVCTLSTEYLRVAQGCRVPSGR